MSMHYDIYTLSEENLEKAKVDSAFLLLLDGDDELYVDEKLYDLKSRQSPFLSSIANSKLGQMLGLFQINRDTVSIPDFTIGEGELVKLFSIDERSLKESEQWSANDASMLAYILEQNHYHPNTVLEFFLGGEYIQSLDALYKTPNEIRDVLNEFNSGEIQITLTENHLDEMLESDLINKDALEYYRKDTSILENWAKLNLEHIIKYHHNCIANNLGVISITI